MENKIIVRKYEEKDLSAMIRIWNEVVEDGVAFPQEECLDEKTGAEFFAAQTYTAVAENMENGQVLGLYILFLLYSIPYYATLLIFNVLVLS